MTTFSNKLKKLMIEFQENAWAEGRMEGRTDPILQDHSSHHRGSNKVKINFSQLYRRKTFNISAGLIFNSFLVETTNPQNGQTHSKRQPHKMIKHTQKIRWLLPTNCLSMFDHFVGLHDLHKFADVIFGITQKPLYITSSNLIR